MKKVLVLNLALAIFIGCSPEQNDTVVSEAVDLTQIINPDTAKAAPQFDATSNGIYKGVFASDDMLYHGVLTINLGNDAKYNAVLEYGDHQRVGFIRTNNTVSSVTNQIEFRGAGTGFSLNVSDFENPIIENAYINNQNAQARVLKETSQNKVVASLGTFVDSSDSSFTGTWDFLSTNTQVINVPLPAPAPPGSFEAVTVHVISELVVTKNGTMFTDTTMEQFTPGAGCGTTLPSGSQVPFFSGDVTILVGGIFSVEINEYAASTQTSTWLGEIATWDFNFSKIQGGVYYNSNCVAQDAGTWSWKGRSGTVTLN
ncbi:hypothetical protein [Ulvibacter litoralis]|uniref:Lipoprotein n=1 Tax=Ulvibacter litoralis TaxID=227084 RepID=A0A1G7FVG9_9FLAO|nr:hypothetical protein [Ulvibacter litoralis]GHC64049.1 hypothetical protein GCM10008083_31660 [Ulvibacter litoralis]SDE79923.1 hypothetical protein SAMN05421855_102807 [Ulvibacter litoralis]